MAPISKTHHRNLLGACELMGVMAMRERFLAVSNAYSGIHSRLSAQLLLAVALIVVASLATQSLTGSASPQDSVAIAKIVRDSQVAEQTLCVPPGVSLAGISVAPHAVVNEMKVRVANTEEGLYTGTMLEAMVALLQKNCAASVTGGQSMEIGGGVSSFSCSNIAVDGDTATATCRAVKWLKSLVKGADGVDTVDPNGPVDVADALQRTPDGWRITEEHISFPPGSGP